ncbi:hypothetical protein GF339_20385 [candidate division KSB3 bacterium]|uniref:Uncharacterized protein n=1 Tax=candidate division KSB3 bacterium TaxID=2044937 RepID=A0A9D5Q7J6_9BACT|nr:hypothetical protein [candidate division KSB3 bacterium]MBD3326955.1 hypothetical protein [candidate division KSB3 bacterium]
MTSRLRYLRYVAVYAVVVLGIMGLLAGCGDDGDDDNGPTDPGSGTTYTVTVPGNAAWTDTTIAVTVGQVVSVLADGTVTYDEEGNTCGPAGADWTDTQDQQDPLWESPHAGLIGKIGEAGTPFFLGAEATFTVDTDGVLLLGINDFWFQANTGEFTVTVQVTDAA